MIRRFLLCAALAVGLAAGAPAQVGPLPGMAVLAPPKAASGCGTPVVTNIGTNANTAGGTVTLTGVTVPAGSLIIVMPSEAAATVGTVSDGVNTYSTAGSGFGIVFYAANASLSSGTITYTKAGSGDDAALSAVYASNILTTSPLDTAVTAHTSGTGTTPSVTSGTPVQSGELFIGMVPPTSTAASVSFTQDTGHGWASPPNFIQTNGTGVGGGNQVNAGTGTKIFAPTLSSSGLISWDATIVGFKHC